MKVAGVVGAVWAFAAALLVAPPAPAADELPLPPELPPLAAEPPAPALEVVIATLDNGLSVWIVPRPGLPRLTARLVVRGGTAYDPPRLPGFAALLADALTLGTEERSAERLAEELQALGGGLVASADRDELELTVDGFSTAAGRLLERLAELALRPAFPPAEVERLRERSAGALERRLSSPGFEAEKVFAQAVYGEHPYRVEAPGVATIEALEPRLLRREHRRRLRPERSLLLVVGEVAAEPLLERVRASFGGWRGEGVAAPEPPPVPRRAERRLLVVDRPGSVQAEVRAGSVIPPQATPEYLAVLLGDAALGGSLDSRLATNLREEKGYVYAISAIAYGYPLGGLLRIAFSCRTEVTGAALLELFYELDRMSLSPPSGDELEEVRRFLAGFYLRRFESQASLVEQLGRAWVRGQPAAAYARQLQDLAALTPEQVRRAAERYFPARQQAVVISGDAAAILPQLAVFGEVEVVEP